MRNFAFFALICTLIITIGTVSTFNTIKQFIAIDLTLSFVQGQGDSHLLVEIRAPREYSVGFDIFCVETNADKPFEKKSSGAFR